jgi:hypothetical protein
MFSRLFAAGATYLRRPRRYFKAFGIPFQFTDWDPFERPEPHAGQHATVLQLPASPHGVIGEVAAVVG